MVNEASFCTNRTKRETSGPIISSNGKLPTRKPMADGVLESPPNNDHPPTVVENKVDNSERPVMEGIIVANSVRDGELPRQRQPDGRNPKVSIHNGNPPSETQQLTTIQGSASNTPLMC